MRAILTWHSIDRSGSPISVSPEEWRGQVAWLDSSAVQVVSLEGLAQGEGGASAVALTFDDGFANFASDAAPALLERGWPVTLFVVTDHVGGDNRWGGRAAPGIPTLPLADWETLGHLQERGVTIGAHTRSHPHLPALAPEAQQQEIVGCRAELDRRLGTAPEAFAYPYGATDPAVTARVAALFRWGCTTVLRSCTPDAPAHALPRIDAWYLRQPPRQARWGTGEFQTWLWARRQARRLRQVFQ
ncbi:MAG: polysaccharide deacetylase family protein [Gemmatimonadota bacterium]|nr:polysaccharide deacetylase family protein [Gemmatimonadota bacterium]